jgi:hypothetical protein
MQVRMRAKNVIKGLVPWADARHTLATRLRRKLAEEGVRAHIASADPSIQRTHALELLQQWYLKSSSDGGSSEVRLHSLHGTSLEQPPAGVPEISPLQQARNIASGKLERNGTIANGKSAKAEDCESGARWSM